MRLSADDDAYLRAFYDDAGSRGWSYEHFRKNHSRLLGAVAEGMPTKGMPLEYGSPDHLVRANFEGDVHRFGHGKTVAQVLRLNQLLKDSQNFEGFKEEAGKVLTALNERNLRTEYDMAKATATQTASAMRAVADGAKFMRYKATLDDKTRPFHASLHNRVFSLATDDWRKFVAPLGWNCRCHNVYEDDHDGEVTTYEDAIRLLGDEEVTRLTRDGFLIDRIDKKKLFTDRQNYLNDLPNPEQFRNKISQLTYAEQGLKPWKDVSSDGLSTYPETVRTREQALADFEDSSTDQVKRFTAHNGMPLFLDEKTLKQQLTSPEQAGRYFTLDQLLLEPNEVYFQDGRYTYLKFYQDDVVHAATVEFDQDTPQTVRQWYQVKPASIDETRKGLLIHHKPTDG